MKYCTQCGTRGESLNCARCGAPMEAEWSPGEEADRYWAGPDAPTGPTEAAAEAETRVRTPWTGDEGSQAHPPQGDGGYPMSPQGAGGQPPPPEHGGRSKGTLVLAALGAVVIVLALGVGALWWSGGDDDEAADDPTTTETQDAAPPTSSPPSGTREPEQSSTESEESEGTEDSEETEGSDASEGSEGTDGNDESEGPDESEEPEESEASGDSEGSDEALAGLEDLRDESLQTIKRDGRWGVVLSTKSDGMRDDKDPTPSGSAVWHLPDIHERHESLAEYYASAPGVHLLRAEDLGSTSGPRDDELWMTVLDLGSDLDTRAKAQDWCEESMHGDLSAEELENICQPRQLTEP